MKKNLLLILLLLSAGFSFGQTYYWVGNSKTSPNSFTNNSNWNTQLDGGGSSRSAAGTSDILIIDGSNVGGTTPQTGIVSFDLTTAGIGQLILQNNAKVVLKRSASGTATLTINGNAGDDLVVDNTSSLGINFAGNAVVVSMLADVTGRISGMLDIANGPHRLVAQKAGALVMASGASVSVNITASTYPFGGPQTNPIAARSGVVFESGSHLYFEGGRSPFANWRDYQIIEFRTGSNLHFRAPNTDVGVYLSSRSLANVFIENNAVVTADGPISKIDNLSIDAGSTFKVNAKGSTTIMGDMVVNGALVTTDGGIGGLVFAGGSGQNVSGSGTISIGSLNIADASSVKLSRDIEVTDEVNVHGDLDFTTYRLTGSANFNSFVKKNIALTVNTQKDTVRVTNLSLTTNVAGLKVTGTGIPENTFVVTHMRDSSWIILSKPPTTTATNVALVFTNESATLNTSNISGFESVSGSVSLNGDKQYGTGTNYIINAPTGHPFGFSTGTNGAIGLGSVTINAAITTESDVNISGGILLNGKLTVRPGDLLNIAEGSTFGGSFDNTSYVATAYDAASGLQGMIRYDAISSATLVPVGSPTHYLPVTILPSARGAFAFGVFEGITANGLVNGLALNEQEKQSKLNSVWSINSIDNIAADILLQWDAALEGSTFATLPDAEIGVIANNGTGWGAPLNTADNTANNASAAITGSGIFSVGAKPQQEPFIFNEIPLKTYGDADFNGGASSLNTAKTIEYTSSDPSVATIVDNKIHITGAGNSTITATQETDGVYPAVNIGQLLTVNQAQLSIKADDKISPEAEVLPVLTATYTGFVNNETSSVLLTPALISTTATSSSLPGTYPIEVSGATSANYSITFESGVMTIQPKQKQTITFATLPLKKYGNGDFSISATSTNSTIPVIFSSSNTNVATVNGNNVHIVGAGAAVITASQVGNTGYFPAMNVNQTLTVDKAALSIAVRDTSKIEGQANPSFTLTFTGFVLNETANNLTAPATVNTTATTTSSAGYYSLTPANAISNNYTISFTAGRLTILPAGGTDKPVLNAYMPNSTTLTARIFSNVPALTDIVLWDLNGKPLIKRNTFLPKGFISANLMVSGVPSGVYIITVRGSGVDLKQMIRIVK